MAGDDEARGTIGDDGGRQESGIGTGIGTGIGIGIGTGIGTWIGTWIGDPDRENGTTTFLTKAVWPSGLRRRLNTPVRKGTVSNPAALSFACYHGVRQQHVTSLRVLVACAWARTKFTIQMTALIFHGITDSCGVRAHALVDWRLKRLRPLGQTILLMDAGGNLH